MYKGPNTGGVSAAPVQYSTGIIHYADVDVAANLGGFRHARIFRNVRIANEAYDGPNGYNWDIEEWPYLVQRTQGSKITINVRIGMLQLRVDKTGTDTYVVQHAQKDQYAFNHDATAHLFTLTRRTNGGMETIQFQDFDQTTNPQGLFFARNDADGQHTEVTSYTTGGDINGLVTARGSLYFELAYTYLTGGKLDYVTLNQLDTYPSPTVTTPLRRTRYDYYDGTNSFGGNNDLKAAIRQKYVSSSSTWVDVATTYYRYYTGGPHHLVKYVVNPATYAEIVALGQDPLNDSPSTDHVPTLADHYFEYLGGGSTDGDPLTRVTKEVARGCVGCGGNGGTSDAGETFTRSNNPSYPSQATANSDFLYNTWMTKTISQNTGGYETVVYTNRTNQVMLKVLRELDTGGPLRQWCTYYEYDTQGRLVMQAEPSAVIGFDESRPDLVGKQSGGTYVFLRNNDGLIRLTT